VLDKIEGAQEKFLALLAGEARADIFCFWESSAGNGGPIIPASQMARLARLDLSLGWDVWFSELK
jgi:hypothetical protein